MYAKITPVAYRTGQAKCLVVRGTSVQLGSRAIVEWSLMGDQATDRRDYESGGLSMDGEDYSAWGTDDSYIYTWLGTKLADVVIESIEAGNYWDAPPAPPPPPPPEPTPEPTPDPGA
jgi:hypothetical protein